MSNIRISVEELATKMRVKPQLIIQMLNSLDIPVESVEARIDESIAQAVSQVITRERAEKRAATEARRKANAAAAAAAAAESGTEAPAPATSGSSGRRSRSSREGTAAGGTSGQTVETPQDTTLAPAPVAPPREGARTGSRSRGEGRAATAPATPPAATRSKSEGRSTPTRERSSRSQETVATPEPATPRPAGESSILPPAVSPSPEPVVAVSQEVPTTVAVATPPLQEVELSVATPPPPPQEAELSVVAATPAPSEPVVSAATPLPEATPAPATPPPATTTVTPDTTVTTTITAPPPAPATPAPAPATTAAPPPATAPDSSIPTVAAATPPPRVVPARPPAGQPAAGERPATTVTPRPAPAGTAQGQRQPQSAPGTQRPPLPGGQTGQRPVGSQGTQPPRTPAAPIGQNQPRPVNPGATMGQRPFQGQPGQGQRQGTPGQRPAQQGMGQPRPQGGAPGGVPGQPRPFPPRPPGQTGQPRPGGSAPPRPGGPGPSPGGTRPPYPPRDGAAPRPQGSGAPRPGGTAGRPPTTAGRDRRPGAGPFIPQPQTTDKAAPSTTKMVKKDLKYSDERYRDQDRQFSNESEQQQQGGRRPGRNQPGQQRRGAAQRRSTEQRSNTQMPSQIELAGAVTVKGLADLLKTDGPTIIKKLMQFGMLASINQEIDFEIAAIVATDLGSSVVAPREAFNPESIVAEEEDDIASLEDRPPVVTVMGHVDHGKTSLLDAIRSTNVASGEAGGITQHIGAYTVELGDRQITFLDTPGHAAFTSMRARGAQVTDIAVLVVAADDGVMPQTVEAINHAKEAQVPIVVAINKIDKPGADSDRVKQALTEYNLIAEEYGGDTVMVPVSAIRGDGLDVLLESILLVADIGELKANPNRRAVGTVIEAKLDKGRGPIATVLVHKGTLSVGDILVVGSTFGRVRAMVDDKGRRVRSAGPSQPVEVVGLSEVPEAGDRCHAVEDERQARILAETRTSSRKEEEQSRSSRVSLEDLFSQMQEGEVKDLKIVLKGDVHGSVEAVRLSLERLSTREIRVVIVHAGVGAISESDVLLASASGAIIIGFNVRPDNNATRIAEQQHVDIRTYRIIYEILDDVTNAMRGMLAPVIRENVIAHVEVREIFRISRVGSIAGSYVLDGRITRQAMVRVIRDGIVIHEGRIASLRRIKDDVREVAAGYECGILLERFNDLRAGDRFEAYVMEEIKRTEL